MGLIDISQALSPDTVVWPGDTPFSQEWVMTMKEGASCNVSTVRMSLHCGTHADAPFHFRDDGARSEEIALEVFMGPCEVVQVRGEAEVSAEDLAHLDLEHTERILFRTRRPCTATFWRDDFTCIGLAAARRLAESSVRLIGIDTASVDAMTSKTLEAHHIMSAAGLVWLENLDLSEAAPGRYELIALPLKILGADACPVRAVLRELT